MLLMTACHKDVDLSGTDWTSSFSFTTTEDGITANAAMNMLMSFMDETNGKMTTTATVTVAGVTYNAGTETDAFTYTFDGKSAGTIKQVDDDTTVTTTFTYDDDAETITMLTGFDAEELAAGMPASVVFTKKK